MKFIALLSFAALAVAAPTLEDRPLEAREVEPMSEVAKRGVDWDVIRIIKSVANEYNLNSREELAMWETCLVESGCQNLNYGDKDSVGVWQQRPSMGWCPLGIDQCRDVRYSTRRFLDVLKVCSRQHPDWSAGRIAQCTQVSEIPDAYDNKRGEAQSLMSEVRTRLGGSSGSSNGGAANVGTKPGGNGGGSSNSGNSSGSCAKTYTVAKGDTCGKIASRTGTSTSTLRSLNSQINGSCSNLKVGWKLCTKKGSAPAPSKGNSSKGNSGSGGCKKWRTVKKGDTCSKIGGGKSVSALRKLNGNSINSSCSNLKVGKKYCVA